MEESRNCSDAAGTEKGPQGLPGSLFLPLKEHALSLGPQWLRGAQEMFGLLDLPAAQDGPDHFEVTASNPVEMVVKEDGRV